MNHENITNALIQLQKENSISKGWSVKDDEISLVEGDTMPTEEELQSASDRYENSEEVIEKIEEDSIKDKIKNWEDVTYEELLSAFKTLL